MPVNKYPHSPALGFTLFELLIAVLVLAVGLLGLATMQAQGLKSNNSAELRTEATFLAMDIIDRMRSTMVPNTATPANPPIVNAAYGGATTPVVINKANTHSCSAPPPAPPACQSTAEQDLSDWAEAVRDQLGGGDATSLTWGARIEQTGGVYMITLMWDDERTGATGTACGGDPEVDMTCFQTLFRP